MENMSKLSDQQMESAVGGIITEEEAIASALEHARLKKDQVEFLKKVELDFEHGRKIYEVEFFYNGLEYEFDIDAESGKILKFKKDRD